MNAYELKPTLEGLAKDLETHDIVEYGNIGLSTVCSRYPVHTYPAETDPADIPEADIIVCSLDKIEDGSELFSKLSKAAMMAVVFNIFIGTGASDWVSGIEQMPGARIVTMSVNNGVLGAVVLMEDES